MLLNLTRPRTLFFAVLSMLVKADPIANTAGTGLIQAILVLPYSSTVGIPQTDGRTNTRAVARKGRNHRGGARSRRRGADRNDPPLGPDRPHPRNAGVFPDEISEAAVARRSRGRPRRARTRRRPDPHLSRTAASGGRDLARRVGRRTGLALDAPCPPPGSTSRAASRRIRPRVLMNAIPARVAGVERLVICAPTPDGVVNPLVLLAAQLAGVEDDLPRRRRAGDRGARLRHGDGRGGGQDHRSRQRLGRGGQTPRLRPCRHRHDRRPVRGADPRRPGQRPRLGRAWT